MEDLKKQIMAAAASGNVGEMRKLKLQIWLRKPTRECFNKEFLEWVNSDEGKAIRAHLEETY